MAGADVIVVGGGVVGLTTALELAKRGLAVTVLDKGEPGREASWAGAGILPPARPGDPRHPLAPLCKATTTLWPDLSNELRELTGIDNGFLKSGGIGCAADGDESTLQGEIEEWRHAGANIEPLSIDELHCEEPGLGPLTGPAYLLPGVCQVRNPRHLKALRMACVRSGVDVVSHEPAIGFDRNGSSVVAVETPTQRITGGTVLVTAGPWSSQLLALAGCRIAVEPIRGQIVLLNCAAPLMRHVVECGPRYLVPRPDGRLLVGSTEERAGFDKRNTTAAIGGLMEFATRLVPALSSATFETAWAGLRPRSVDGLPYLGRLPEMTNLFVAAGHFREGLNLSPITARLMAQLICDEKPELSMKAFDPSSRLSEPDVP